MKPEREIIWIITILQSDFTKGFFKKKWGTKKEFERLVKSPENSSEFGEWFKELIQEGCIEEKEVPVSSDDSWTYNGYRGVKNRLEERLKAIPNYDIIRKYFVEKSWAGELM